MIVTRRDVSASGKDGFFIFRLRDWYTAAAAQEITQADLGILASVLRDDNWHGKSFGQSRKQCLQCVQSADGSADDHDLKLLPQMLLLLQWWAQFDATSPFDTTCHDHSG